VRVLVISAGCGAGHNRAAEAIDAWAKEAFPNWRTEWFDALKYTSRAFQKLYGESYIWIVNHSPTTWGILYGLMGKKVDRPALDKAVRLFDKLAYKKLMAHVREFEPDAVIATHFLPTNVVLAHLGREAPPVHVVVTDFDVHSLWVNRGADGYFVASDEVRHLLARYGYPADRIRVTGIPVLPAFSKEMGREAAARKLGLDPGAPTVLFMSGGFGMGPMAESVERLLALEDLQLVVIAGRNEKLRSTLAGLAKGTKTQVHGFVTNVHEFMEASDVVISKSGGLTTSECLARGVPMVVFSPIPGQEERNCDFLLERGAAVKASSLEALDFKVRELLDDPARLARMKAAARAAARPLAGRDILQTVADESPARR
jgi:processive 1,2-diacylglycerol beta-glucosyltransferase